MSNNNPFLEDKKESSKKIGFDSALPISKGNKPVKYQDNLPGKPLRTITKLCTIFGAIFASLTAMYYLLPIFSAFIGGIIAVILVCFMIFSVVMTLGMILLIDDYRYWIGHNMMDVPNFFFNLSENVIKLAQYFLVTAIPGLVLCTTGLILGIVGTSKKYRSFVSYIVVNSIFLSIALLFTIIYFMNGMKIFEN